MPLRARCLLGGVATAYVANTALKQVLVRHPGPSDVHLRLVNGNSSTVLRLDDQLRVETSSSLMGDLKALLGAGCLAG